MEKFIKNILKTTCAMAAIAAVIALLYISGSKQTLVISDSVTGAEIKRLVVDNNTTFSVEFVHSVNQSPVTDFYRIDHGKIYVYKTVYYGFGAGVQTEISEEETLTMGKDGSMTVDVADREMKDLQYIVGTVSDHILRIGEEEISLRELCGKNRRIKFSASY